MHVQYIAATRWMMALTRPSTHSGLVAGLSRICLGVYKDAISPVAIPIGLPGLMQVGAGHRIGSTYQFRRRRIL